MKLAIFDFDGTIIDSLNDITVTLNETLDHYGKTAISKNEVKRFVGPDIDVLFKHAIEDDQAVDLEEFRNEFRSRYKKNLHLDTKMYDGILDTLKTLKEKNIVLSILTNKPEASTKIICDKFDLTQYFDLIVGPDTYGFPKPDPRSIHIIVDKIQHPHDKTVMIGDTENDILAAKAAGVSSVGVSYGYRSHDELIDLRPHHIVHSPSELTEHLLTQICSD